MEINQEQKLSEENVQAKSNTEDVELNEDQLEALAGGVVGEDGCIPFPKFPTVPIYF